MTNLANAVIQWNDLKKRLLARMPELADDPDCLLDTLDGITSVKEQMAALIRTALREKSEAEGLGEYIKSLSDRKAAKLQRAEKMRAMVAHFMADAGLKNITTADFTATRKAVPPSVIITVEELIPDEFCRIKREADKTKIKQSIKDGHAVPGAVLSNSGETLQVKV